jgi:hypothetical protein
MSVGPQQSSCSVLSCSVELHSNAGVGMVQPISPHEASGSRVPLDMSSFPKSSGLSLFRVLRLWYRASVLRILVMEFRNLLCHIRFSLETYELESQGQTGLIRLGLRAPLAFQSQSCKRAYIRYMQQIQAERPHMTILDLLLLGKAWQAGSEWNGPAGTLRTQDECSSANPVGGNSMPPLATQQLTKHDPSNPLPLPASRAMSDARGRRCK